jgi:hypothetical protein
MPHILRNSESQASHNINYAVVLYGFKALSLTLRGERKMQMFRNEAPRKTYRDV